MAGEEGVEEREEMRKEDCKRKKREGKGGGIPNQRTERRNKKHVMLGRGQIFKRENRRTGSTEESRS